MIIRVKVSRTENLQYFDCTAGDIVNVEIEEYIAGVVASEIGNAPIEACKAQAIAARTFAMHYVGDDKFITDQSSTHQAFRASRWDAKQYPNANDATAQTAGMVLTYDGKLLKTCSYSSSNGGRTVSSEERWGGVRPYLIAQDDPWDAAACEERRAAGRSITKGHGVGMSQYGASWAAQNGIGYREILGFYYVGAVIAPGYGKVGDTMTYDPKKVIDIALAEVGYLEKETNSQLDSKTANAGDENITKYARDLDALGFYNGRKQGVAWCDMFYDWCMVAAYGMAVALAITFQPYGSKNCGAGCKYSRNYYKNKGRLFNDPEPGDQIFFYSKDKSQISHTGLVYAVDSSYVYTVEGNTSSSSGVVANGGAVAKKKYKRSYERIAGYGRPDYGMTISEVVTPNTSGQTTSANYTLGDRTLKKGDKGTDVADMQKSLAKLGYDLGSSGADGDFGSKTDAAVRQFQQDNGLEVDGKFGKKSLEALNSALAALETKKQPEETQSAPEAPVATGQKIIKITAKSVNARVGDSTDYDSVGHLEEGETIEYVVTAPNGWNAGRWKDRIVWVSPKYSTVTTA